MINLLSIESQNYYRAARLNLKLRNYIFILLGVLVIILGLFAAGFYLTMTNRMSADAELKQHEQETTAYQGVRNEAKTFADNLKTAKTILSRETLYSELIVKVAKTLPSSAVLTSLTLDGTTIEKPLSLSARVKTKADALVLKSTLESSPLFENVSLNNVTDQSDSPTDNRVIRAFPVTVTLTTTLTKAATVPTP